MTDHTPDPNRPDGERERLVRIETRLVKYQEHNVQQMDQMIESVDKLGTALQQVVEKLSEAGHG